MANAKNKTGTDITAFKTGTRVRFNDQNRKAFLDLINDRPTGQSVQDSLTQIIKCANEKRESSKLNRILLQDNKRLKIRLEDYELLLIRTRNSLFRTFVVCCLLLAFMIVSAIEFF